MTPAILAATENDLAVALRDARVSDHAVLRWIERAHGVDLRAVRAEILNRSVLAGLHHRATQVHLPDHRVSVVLKAPAIVTVLPFGGGGRR